MNNARLLTCGSVLVCVAMLGCGAPDEDVGMISQPLSFIPSLPFPKGVTSKVTQGWDGTFSHNTPNLKYALDFGSVAGKNVLAVGDGKVVFVKGDCVEGVKDCNFGWGNAVVVDHGDGVFSKCAHLVNNSIPSAITEGKEICRGAVLGVVGNTGNSFGAHIHFQLQSSGNINGPSISFDRFQETAGIPAENDYVTSQNEEGAACGSVPPEQECTVVIETAEVIIEENSACAKLTAGALTDEQGHNGHAYSLVQEHAGNNYIKGLNWMLNFAAASSYKLSLYIPAGVANRSPSVEYKIQFGGQTKKVSVNQSAAADSWVDLGTFAFAAGGDQWVRVGDNYQDSSAQGKRVAIDALRVTPVSACECSGNQPENRDCPSGGTQSRTCDGCNWTEWSSCSEDGAGGSSGSGGSNVGGRNTGANGPIELVDGGRKDSGGDGGSSDWGSDSDDEGSGCSASGTAPRSIGAFVPVLLAFAGWIARRKRSNV